MKPITLRPMRVSDLEEVMRIEQRAYPFPWRLGNFEDCLNGQYYCFVYEHSGVGMLGAYVVLMTVLDEMHILNLCVNPDYHGQGLGSALLTAVEAFGEQQRIGTCFLEVRPSNVTAIRLYLRHGFNEIGQRRGYYPAKIGREDAIVMAKTFLHEDWTNYFSN